MTVKKILHYPSLEFQDSVSDIIEENVEFTVVVRRDCRKKKAIIKQKLDYYISRNGEESGMFRTIFDVIIVFDFMACLDIIANGRGYSVTYDDSGDLEIVFTPSSEF